MHHQHRRSHQRFGTLKRDLEYAQKEAARINGLIAAGAFQWPTREPAVPQKPTVSFDCKAVVERYLMVYTATHRASTHEAYTSLANTHLIPFFGEQDVRALDDEDLLRFIDAKKAAGLGTRTIRNALAVLRQACSSLVERRLIDRNPLAGGGTRPWPCSGSSSATSPRSRP